MRKITIYILGIATLFMAHSLVAQEVYQEKIEILKEQKAKITEHEKEALKVEVEVINDRLGKGEINEEEASSLKVAAAEKHALNIENRISIINNKISLLERNGVKDNERLTIGLSLGNDDTENFMGVKIDKEGIATRKYDLRTFSEVVFAFGLNNTITKGQSFNETPYEIGGSRFAELGILLNTRVFKESNWLRFKYGFSFQFNGLNSTDNLYQVDTGMQTELQPFGQSLDKSKFRMDNLVVPLFFEIGPSKKVEKENYFRYNTNKSFKMGLGGYAGVNLGVRQKLKYKVDGDKVKEKSKADFNTNNFIYGLAGYVGYGDISLYLKYDLNPIFKDNLIETNNVSLGIRWDLD